MDATGKLFDRVDFTEATIFFQVHRKLPQTIAIEVWGVTLIGNQNDKDYYVAGISTINFEGVTSGLLEVSIYQSGEKLSKGWGEPFDHEDYQYHLGGVLDWPRGYCQLGMNATGKVTVSFETNDCVSTGDYVMNPEKYTYKEE